MRLQFTHEGQIVKILYKHIEAILLERTDEAFDEGKVTIRVSSGAGVYMPEVFTEKEFQEKSEMLLEMIANNQPYDWE